jgi:peptidoglycan/LPS O-acetylase OafA/YrhL
MSLQAPWAYFVLMAVVMAIAATPLLRFVDATAEAGERVSAIDGLRGFLALGVFVFHLVITHRYIATGVWAVPESRFYAVLGPVGVSMFFMLTGFLFWGKLLRTHGRPDWRALYVGRLFRIGPAYLLVVLVMLAIVFARSGLALHEPAPVVIGAVLQWLALGLIDTQPNVNGQAAGQVLAGVTWTLWYEWVFYASLVLLAPLARRRTHLGLVLLMLAGCLAAKLLWRLEASGFAALFAIGMAVASLRHGRPAPAASGRGLSALALMALVLVFFSGGSGYGTGTALLLAVFFACVCSGATLFGLLVTPAARRLGQVSYSLYLMQGLVLTLVFAIGPVTDWAMTSPAAYWAVGMFCAIGLLLVAALGYRWVEQPGIRLGRQLLRPCTVHRDGRTAAQPSGH